MLKRLCSLVLCVLFASYCISFPAYGAESRFSVETSETSAIQEPVQSSAISETEEMGETLPEIEEVEISEVDPEETIAPDLSPDLSDEEELELQSAYTSLTERFEAEGAEMDISYEDFITIYQTSGFENVQSFANVLEPTNVNSEWYDNIGVSNPTLPQKASYSGKDLLSRVQKGDILYEVDGGSITETLNHIAIVEGIFWDSGQQQFYIRTIEAVKGGVTHGVFDENRLSYRGVQIYRVKNVTSQQRHGAVSFCINQLGKKYQIKGIGFTLSASPNQGGWYCSELVWAAYYNQGINLNGSSIPTHIYRPQDLAASSKLTRIYPSTTKPASQFRDLSGVSWAKPAITYLTNNGMMSGVSTYYFEPNTTLSRGMLISVLYRMEGQPANQYGPAYSFADNQDTSQYYYHAIQWANEAGIASGYEDNTFRPDKAINREELASFLYRYARYKGYSLTAPSTALNKFTDRSSVSSWAVTAMRWAVYHDVISGTSTTTLEPTGTATRAQAAVAIVSFKDAFM